MAHPPGRPRVDKKRLAFVLIGALAVVALVAGLVWFGPWRDDASSPAGSIDAGDPPTKAAVAFASHWQQGTLAQAPVTAASGNVAQGTALITGGLGAVGPGPTVKVTKVERSSGAGDRAEAQATVTWKLDTTRTWTYETRIPLVEESGAWVVAWTPAVIEPSLHAGDALRTSRTVGQRGQIVDAAGTPLTSGAGSVVVGIKKSRATDPEATARTVAQLTGVEPEALVARVRAAGPDEFIEVITLDRPAYDRIRAQVQPLPGTVFREEAATSGVPANFARGVLGATGPATKEIADASKGAVKEGDLTGLSGLQASQNAVLSGSAGLAIEVVPPAPATPRAIKSFPGTDGKNLTVTLDQKIQSAADEVLARTDKSALVAIRISTGDVVAIANGSAGSSAYDRALLGRYPPGSVFKVPSTYALLQTGLTGDTVVNCPSTITVGKVFRNSEGSAYGQVPFRTDFAKSCNTAFVGQASKVTAQQLADAAATLGYRKLDLGVPMFNASVPVDGDATEHAAQMIGQGRVEGTVLHVALASASVGSGTSVQPRLIIDPAHRAPTRGPALPEPYVAELRNLMRGVVTDGTGTVLKSVPGPPVQAKTGTAEFGTEVPPETHAWITGYQGDIAFAVLVDSGGFGGAVAGPLAADFLKRINLG